MEPTYAEVAWVLEQLGYVDKSTDEFFRFYNEKEDHLVILPFRTSQELLNANRFAAVSSELEHTGVIQHIHDLGKMIKKRRLKKTSQHTLAKKTGKAAAG
jgi:hypothetical protein